MFMVEREKRIINNAPENFQFASDEMFCVEYIFNVRHFKKFSQTEQPTLNPCNCLVETAVKYSRNVDLTDQLHLSYISGINCYISN
jgi:hypothetical protein